MPAFYSKPWPRDSLSSGANYFHEMGVVHNKLNVCIRCTSVKLIGCFVGQHMRIALQLTMYTTCVLCTLLTVVQKDISAQPNTDDF
jgi:hypothetical protein